MNKKKMGMIKKNKTKKKMKGGDNSPLQEDTKKDTKQDTNQYSIQSDPSQLQSSPPPPSKNINNSDKKYNKIREDIKSNINNLDEIQKNINNIKEELSSLEKITRSSSEKNNACTIM